MRIVRNWEIASEEICENSLEKKTKTSMLEIYKAIGGEKQVAIYRIYGHVMKLSGKRLKTNTKGYFSCHAKLDHGIYY